jgi:adenylate cyclase
MAVRTHITINTHMRWITHWATALITLALLGFYGWKDPYAKQLLRFKSFDVIQQYDTTTVSQDIAFIEIDEKSIEKYGQWPWKRDILADTIGKLRDAGAGIIVLPILFSEEDRLGGDLALVSQLTNNGVVVAQVGTTQANKNAVPRGVAKIGDPMPWLFEWPGMLGPIEDIGEAADGVGVINTAPEIDGVTRRLPLLMRVGEEIYPSMAIEIIRVATGDPSYQVKTEQGGITKMRVPKYDNIQTDSNARIWLRWNKQFNAISLADEHLYDQLKGKTVIIGITAEGLGGIVATPKGEKHSHLLIATALQTIVNGDNIIRFDYATFVEWSATVILGLILILAAVKAPYWLVGALILTATITPVYGAYIAFTRHLMLWDWSWLVLISVIVGFHATFNRFVVEFFEKQKIKKQFAGYASPTVVRMLQENPKLIKEGTKKEISICFSDLRGFTPLGESFGDDVKGLTKLMNGYMDSITQPILDAEGMVIKYIGDASMHIHGAPLDDPQHAKHAVQTGLNMLRAVEQFNDKITAEGRPPIGMGAGINSGLGYLGEMGSTKRHSYDVLGDAVSTAARIESKCKEYGCLLLIGGATVERCKDDFFFLKIDDLAVKGKSVGIPIYTVIDKDRDEQARAQHDTMHGLYRSQKFDEAIHQCRELRGAFGGQLDDYYDMWIERCQFQKTQNLPEDWDGVTIAQSK